MLEPKFITPVHDYSKRPLQLFWVDGVALQAIAYEQSSQSSSSSTGGDTTDEEEVSLLIQVVDYDTTDDSADTATTTTTTTNHDVLLYPLQPPVSSITQFKTTPSVHAGYAVTWFGLSTAGDCI